MDSFFHVLTPSAPVCFNICIAKVLVGFATTSFCFCEFDPASAIFISQLVNGVPSEQRSNRNESKPLFLKSVINRIEGLIAHAKPVAAIQNHFANSAGHIVSCLLLIPGG